MIAKVRIGLKISIICVKQKRSEAYINHYFADVKAYSNVIEHRVHDTYTMEQLLEDNAQVLELVQKYRVNYVLIRDKYEISIDL